jgi:Cathepsin propeptide inhibitor domain (I29)
MPLPSTNCSDRRYDLSDDRGKMVVEENDEDDIDSFMIEDQSFVANNVQSDTNSSTASDYQVNKSNQVSESNVVTMFDPYNPSSDRPSLIDDDEQSVRTSNTEIGFLEMEEEIDCDGSGIAAQNNRSVSFQPSNQQYQAKDNEAVEPVLTSSGLLLTHRKAVTPKPKVSFRHSNDVISYPYRDEYNTASRPQHDMISFDDEPQTHLSDLRQQHHFHGISPSSSYLPSSSKKYDGEYYRHLEFESNTRSNGSWLGNKKGYDPHWTILHQLGRTLSYVRLWVIASAVVLLVGTLVLIKHSVRSSRMNASNSFRPSVNKISQSNQNIEFGFFPDPDGNTDEETIILLPLPDIGLENKHASHSLTYDRANYFVHNPNRRLSMLNHHLEDDNSSIIRHHDNHVSYTNQLRSEFDAWTKQHNKQYKDVHEKESRFHIWTHNHRKTEEKNARHGPCKMTGKAVFGSNHFKDLTQEEFMAQQLTGYTGPRTDQEPTNHQSSGVLGPHIPTARHPDIHRRITEINSKNWWSKYTNHDVDSDTTSDNGGAHWWSSYTYNSDSTMSYTSSSTPNCDWYDVSCLLQYIFSTYFYGVGGTMEPAYDANSYPTGTIYFVILLNISF